MFFVTHEIQTSVSKNKFCGDTAMLFHLQMIYGCFHTATTELNSFNRLCGLQNLKYVLFGPLQNKFVDPWSNLRSKERAGKRKGGGDVADSFSRCPIQMEAIAGLLGTIPSPLWALSPPLPHPQAEASWCPLKTTETWNPWSWCGPSAEAIPPTPPWWVCPRHHPLSPGHLWPLPCLGG